MLFTLSIGIPDGVNQFFRSILSPNLEQQFRALFLNLFRRHEILSCTPHSHHMVLQLGAILGRNFQYSCSSERLGQNVIGEIASSMSYLGHGCLAMAFSLSSVPMPGFFGNIM